MTTQFITHKYSILFITGFLLLVGLFFAYKNTELIVRFSYAFDDSTDIVLYHQCSDRSYRQWIYELLSIEEETSERIENYAHRFSGECVLAFEKVDDNYYAAFGGKHNGVRSVYIEDGAESVYPLHRNGFFSSTKMRQLKRIAKNSTTVLFLNSSLLPLPGYSSVESNHVLGISTVDSHDEFFVYPYSSSVPVNTSAYEVNDGVVLDTLLSYNQDTQNLINSLGLPVLNLENSSPETVSIKMNKIGEYPMFILGLHYAMEVPNDAILEQLKSYLAQSYQVEEESTLPDGTSIVEYISDSNLIDFEPIDINGYEQAVVWHNDMLQEMVLLRSGRDVYISNSKEFVGNQQKKNTHVCSADVRQGYAYLDAGLVPFEERSILLYEDDNYLRGCLY